MNDNTNVTIISDKVADLLDSLCNKLGTTADHLFKVMVRQAKIQVLIYFIQLIVMGVLYFPIQHGWDLLLPKMIGDKWPSEIQMMVVFLGIFTCVWLVMSLVTIFIIISDGITGLLNPEAAAYDAIFFKITKS